MKIILATSNPGKLREMQTMLSGMPFNFLSPDQVGRRLEIEEDGETFAENALKKARAYVDWYGEAALADDTGLEVDVLNGAPGVQSKRWLGPDTPESDLVPSLLKRLEQVPEAQRGAQFRTAVALALPDGRYFIEEGIMRGSIAPMQSDRNLEGLPYRQIFFIPQFNKLYAELTPEEEASLMNHRRIALQGLVKTIQPLFADQL